MRPPVTPLRDGGSLGPTLRAAVLWSASGEERRAGEMMRDPQFPSSRARVFHSEEGFLVQTPREQAPACAERARTCSGRGQRGGHSANQAASRVVSVGGNRAAKNGIWEVMGRVGTEGVAVIQVSGTAGCASDV